MTTHKEALKHLKAITEAFGPDEGIELDQKAWGKLHAAIKAALEAHKALNSPNGEEQPEQHQDWCASLTQLLMSMPPKPAPCNCKPPQRTAAQSQSDVEGEDSKTWVGLTNEDVRQCSQDVVAGGKENCVDRFAYAIEAKLKEKNERKEKNT